jgi:hypothetical protein
VLRQRRRFCVDFTNFVLVFDVEVDVALAVDLCKLGFAADGNRGRVDLAGFRIEYG